MCLFCGGNEKHTHTHTHTQKKTQSMSASEFPEPSRETTAELSSTALKMIGGNHHQNYSDLSYNKYGNWGTHNIGMNERTSMVGLSDKMCNKLTFDLSNFKKTQKLNLIEYAQFIYYHFIHSKAIYRLGFNDTKIINKVESQMFIEPRVRDIDRMPKGDISLHLFDTMYEIALRYLQQKTYANFAKYYLYRR